MKKRFFILLVLFVSIFLNAQSQTNDPAQCKTFIKFINKTNLRLEVSIYDKAPGQFGTRVVNVFTIAPGKEKKMKAEDGVTYYYGAKEPHEGLVDIGAPAPKIWKGSADAEECKTIEEVIE